MSFSNSGFKSSSFNSDFGNDFSTKEQNSPFTNYTQFPKGPTVGSEMTDLYCTSSSNETYLVFVQYMTTLQKHTKAYMDNVDKTNYRQMASALTAVPDFKEIKSHLLLGRSGKEVCDFYTSRMIISK